MIIRLFRILFFFSLITFDITGLRLFALSNGNSTDDYKLLSAEYWLNENYATRKTIDLTGEAIVDLNKTLDFSSLEPNAYMLTLRFKDKGGLWSTPYSTYFFIREDENVSHIQYVEKAEYWLNDNYSTRKAIDFTGGAIVDLKKIIDFSSLAPSTYKLTMRFKDKAGLWSTPYSTYFFKRKDEYDSQIQYVEKAEYWLNDNYSMRKTIDFTGGAIVDLNKTLDFSSIAPNAYKLTMRFQDKNKLWSVPSSTYFFKQQLTTNPNRDSKIISYRYWIDDNIVQAKTELFSTPNTYLDLVAKINMDIITNVGIHKLTLQFEDESGLYSTPISFSVVVNESNQYAWFDADKVKDCGVLTVTFNNLSKGAVAYNWTFGDGTNSSELNPTHTYTQSGKYSVTLSIMTNEGNSLDYTRTDYLRVYDEPVIDSSYKDVYPSEEDSITLRVGTFYAYRWLLDGSTKEYLVVSNNPATYLVEVFNENGCSIIDTIMVHAGTPTDILLTDNPSAISVYPNPVQDNIYLKGESTLKINNIEVFDLLGHVVKKYKGFELTNNETEALAVSFLSPGLYILKVETNEKTRIFKFTKK